MSIHPSLKGVDNLVGQRSVFTRIERLQKLMRDGKYEEEGSPFGLPKVRTHFKVKTKKVEKDGSEEDADASQAEAGAEAGETQAE